MSELLAKIDQTYLARLSAEVAAAEAMFAAQRVSDTGRALEIAVSRFLGHLLPSHIGVGRGHVASRDWATASEEIDIILFDRRYVAGFPYVGHPNDPGSGLALFAANAVLGCIAVTKTLSWTKLRKSMANLQTAKELLLPETVTNTMHFDVPVGGAASFRGGVTLDRSLTAVIGFEGRFLSQNRKGKRCPYEGRELIQRLDRLAAQSWFSGSRLDLIYTVDGVVAYPMITSEEGLRHPTAEDWIGRPKYTAAVELQDGTVRMVRPSDQHAPMLVFEDHRADESGLALRLFLIHVFLAAGWIVRSSADFNPLLPHPASREVVAPLLGRSSVERELNEGEGPAPTGGA